jgi:2-oxoglutarate ferredoxin oxidoreductase subunit gamma
LIEEVKEGGAVFYDSDLVKIRENPKVRQVSVASTSSAKELGRQMVANVVMLGAMVEGTRILDADQVKACLKESVPPGTEELNLKAFDKGRALFKG